MPPIEAFLDIKSRKFPPVQPDNELGVKPSLARNSAGVSPNVLKSAGLLVILALRNAYNTSPVNILLRLSLVIPLDSNNVFPVLPL